MATEIFSIDNPYMNGLVKSWDENAEMHLEIWRSGQDGTYLITGKQGYGRKGGLFEYMKAITTPTPQQTSEQQKAAALNRIKIDKDLARVTPDWIKNIAQS